MSHVLNGLLSEAVADLYQRLLAAGRLRLDEHPELESSDEMRELIDRGFARECHTGERECHTGAVVVVPVEPARAVENAVLAAQRRILDQQRMLVRVREQLALLQRTYVAGTAGPAEATGIEVLTDPAEIGALSAELFRSAERDFASLETAGPATSPARAPASPDGAVERGVRLRTIVTRAVLEVADGDELVRQRVAGAWELRVLLDLPTRVVLVDDRAALLPLEPTGTGGAVLVQAPVIVAMLRSYFEMLWWRAVPLGTGGSGRLGGAQDRILRLMLSGMTDAAIARHLRTSERTVRRHVAVLLDMLGVDNRTAAAVVAVREGLLD
jgi:DNA-binding CsgD family transcriptional regulator